jgi:hypothetical protein
MQIILYGSSGISLLYHGNDTFAIHTRGTDSGRDGQSIMDANQATQYYGCGDELPSGQEIESCLHVSRIIDCCLLTSGITPFSSEVPS